MSGKTSNGKQPQIDSTAKAEMLSLYKRQKELLTKSLDIKKKQFEEIQSKQKVGLFLLLINNRNVCLLLVSIFEKEIEKIAQRMQSDRSQAENLIRLLFEHRSTSGGGNGGVTMATSGSKTSINSATSNYLDNLLLESDIKKKIMLVALNLASDPSVSHVVQRQRREFYEKTKKKVRYQ